MRRRRFSSLLAGAAWGRLAGWPARAQENEACPAPLARDDGWPAGSPGGDKAIDNAALCRMAGRIAASGANIHSVLAVHGGRLVFERYFEGGDEVPGYLFGRRAATVRFTPDTLHDMKSVTKSVASLAFGIAVDRGLVRGIDEPVFNFFPELADLRTAEKDRILLRHVLDMTAGLEWIEATPATGDFNNDEARMYLSADPCRYVLGRPMSAPAGRQFHYSTGALMLVSAIFHKATGQVLDEFARANLFDPLRIAQAPWSRTHGETNAGAGLRLRPRDMAKLGQLVLSGGRWDGRQVVSREWVDASTAQPVEATDHQTYGHLWWGGTAAARGRTVRWIGALGRGGQSIRIVPERDLVVVVTAGYYQDYSEQAFRTQYGVFRDVLQAVAPA